MKKMIKRPTTWAKRSNRRSKKSSARDAMRMRFECCSSNSVSDTGHYSRGMHTHARREFGPIDHATGVGFRKDESTTKAVLKQMRELGVI